MKIFKINELRYSSDFFEILKKMTDNKIAKVLLSLVNRYGYSEKDQTDINQVKLDINNIEQIMFDTKSKKDSFISVRIGKIIRKILTDNKIEFTTKDIELFVNGLKSVLSDDVYTFKLVTGKEIKKYYKQANYAKEDESGSSLYCSCMTDKTEYLDIYTQNKNCSLLVLLGTDGKVYGRSMVWKAKTEDNKDIIFMDTIYVSHYFIEHKFIRYANENNLYRSIKDSDGDKKIKSQNGDIVDKIFVMLDRSDFKYYPYVDTVCYLYDNILSNKPIQTSEGIIKMLRSTNGTFRNQYSPDERYIYFEEVSYKNIQNYIDPNNANPNITSDLFLDIDYESIDFYKKEKIDFIILLNIDKDVIGYAPIINASINGTIYERFVESYCAETEDLADKIKQYLEDNHIPYSNDDNQLVLDGKTTDISEIYMPLKEKHDFTNISFILDLYVYVRNTNRLYKYIANLKNGDDAYYFSGDPVGKLVYKNPKDTNPYMINEDSSGIVYCELDNRYYYREDCKSVYVGNGYKMSSVHKDDCIEIKDKHGKVMNIYTWSRFFYPNLNLEDQRRMIYYLIKYSLPKNYNCGSSYDDKYEDYIYYDQKSKSMNISISKKSNGLSREETRYTFTLNISQKNLNYIISISGRSNLTYKFKSIKDYLSSVNSIFDIVDKSYK